LTLAAGNLRFLGAAVVHATSSAIVGISLGIVFYKSRIYKIFFGIVGLLCATALHGLFNFFIMKGTDVSIVSTISILWVVGIFVIFAFQKLAQLYTPYNNNQY
jgi:RsiW-degrading membrane proteinase PrsW (M82 family)